MTGFASVTVKESKVGIFWGVPRGAGFTLVTDATPLAAAEPYGDLLTHSRGHYEVWEAWRRLGGGGLARRGLPGVIALSEYEAFPRGRIVYDTEAETFTIYADRKLQTAAFLGELVRAFGLGDRRRVVRSDAHYRS